MTSPSSGLVPVQVGHPSPDAGMQQASQRRSTLIDPRLDWGKHGLEPRWTGMETSGCAAALEPSFDGLGADELNRFLAGARARNETALAVLTMGDATENDQRPALMRDNTRFFLPGMTDMLVARRLPIGGRPTLAAGLGPVEKDLGLRLLNRPADAPWWVLKLIAPALEPAMGPPAIRRATRGRLHPILIDGLGEPTAAVWVSAEGEQRWYVIPDATDWNPVLGWLVQRALPAYVPNTLRRARSPHFHDPDLQTPAETEARRALAAEELRHQEEMTRLREALQEAKAEADPLREGLLYGTGTTLEEAVDTVLKAAGFTTTKLDTELQGTRSADLLAILGQHRILVEIKSATGEAAENLATDVQRHLSTWPELQPGTPVDGAVLIVSHQLKKLACDRSTVVYQRPEFVASLRFPVVSARALFDWWRLSDWVAVQKALLGNAASAVSPPPVPGSDRRPWWRRGQRDDKS
ncbi:hypothetical protein ACQEVF_57085 [Nonomuraea polychroma]|uniref:hypothetical protein n=1 Tax=Nonomuraea polychroma TaxID=46176 RepID=UPI003D8C9834